MRNLVITFLFLIISLISLTLFVGVNKVTDLPNLVTYSPHFYEKSNISLAKIHLSVLYVIPKDALTKKDDSWKTITESKLKDLIAFHKVQFKETSSISYDFFPEPIIGEKTVKEYGTKLNDNESDNDALTPLAEEITRRVLTNGGDLAHFKIHEDTQAHNVYLIIFEGQGAAGNDRFSLISRSYLVDTTYKETASTFLAHEFYHTLGMPDNYETSMYQFKNGEQFPISLVTKKDIMGQVNIPLTYSYIDKETLKKMGI